MADRTVYGDRGNSGLPMMYRDIFNDGTAFALTVMPCAYLFRNITGTGTTVVKNAPGILKAVIVNGLGTVASACTIYNNTAGSGTKVGTINTLSLSGNFDYDVWMDTGITIVTTGILAPDLTIVYV